MGLDMYAFSVKDTGNTHPSIDYPLHEDKFKQEIYYWRKFNALHGWMEKLYRTKGGLEEFNCTSVELNQGDLDQLIVDSTMGKLQPTAGFFFGPMEIDEGDMECIKDFYTKACNEIAEGNRVYYYSWW